MDPALLDGFEGLSVLRETACGLFGIGAGAVGGVFHQGPTRTGREVETVIRVPKGVGICSRSALRLGLQPQLDQPAVTYRRCAYHGLIGASFLAAVR